MMPLDPHSSVPSGDTSAKLPEPGEDRLVEELVEGGVNSAENDLRETVESEEEDRAKDSPHAEENLDDIEHPPATPPQRPAELDAMERREGP
ncbi:hypothetical protein [Haloferula sargassicola]|uniref:Uncharacterized protein n=1 Tax=Haloferula sargassicola TaxID=490096 RepID=A0ABP9UMZ1_9BACT